ncbi:MAG: response regulator, partial [Acidobacteria bacterium]|nr:response regulator [Acidobacteriota bacterium]
ILDVQMPGLDGFETAALIREREKCRSTPIIFLTGAFGADAYQFKGYSVGAVDYLLKPVAPEILRSKVEVFVELAKKNVLLERLNETLARQAAELEAANKRRSTTGCATKTDRTAGCTMTVASIQFDANPLLEERAWVRAHDVARRPQAGRGVPQAKVEDQEPRRRQKVLPRAAGPRGNRKTDEHVFEQLVIRLNRWL